MTEIEAIKERHSVRNYMDKEIEQDKIDQLNGLISKCNEEADETVTFKDKGGPYSKVDLGIVKYNFEVGANFAKNNN